MHNPNNANRKIKKIAGCDGLTQELLIISAPILTAPLTAFNNQSIENGKFTGCCKEAYVNLVLKKSDKELKENYRSVSCLTAASELLERIVCDQTTDSLESNNIDG